MQLARRLACLGIALAIVGTSARARACASCGCGDPTLTATGIEKPYKNRLRIGLSERVGTSENGTGDDLQHVVNSRTQLSVSYTPLPRLTLVAFLPFIDAELSGPGASTQHVAGLGDFELRAHVVVARDRAFAPHHLLWLIAGVKAPTGPRLFDDAHVPYADDDQPGSGSWDPLGGLTYAWFGGLTSFYTSFLVRYPTEGPRGYRYGLTLRSTSVAQLQPFSWLALQLGVDLHNAWADTVSGAISPDTGGFVAALVPGALINPWRDLLLHLAVEVPVYQALKGNQSVGPQLTFAISYDVL